LMWEQSSPSHYITLHVNTVVPLMILRLAVCCCQ